MKRKDRYRKQGYRKYRDTENTCSEYKGTENSEIQIIQRYRNTEI